jgi:hypothetical protein
LKFCRVGDIISHVKKCGAVGAAQGAGPCVLRYIRIQPNKTRGTKAWRCNRPGCVKLPPPTSIRGTMAGCTLVLLKLAVTKVVVSLSADDSAHLAVFCCQWGSASAF